MGTIKLIFGIGMIVAIIVGGVALVPPYLANYQFEDALNNEALAATYSTKSEEDIKNIVYKRAQDMDIPLTREGIRVQRVGMQGTGSLAIDASYTVHVNLPGYPMDLNFHAATKNKGVW